MKIDILTLFPEMFSAVFEYSIIGRAQKENYVSINIHQLRNWADGKHQKVDDRPFGGGVGMLLKIEPIHKAIKSLNRNQNARVILTDAGGEIFTQKKAQKLCKEKHLIFICGRYEGVDHRVHEHIADEILSVGEFVLTGGEIPTMIMVDTIVRLIPGVLRKEEAVLYESFSESKDQTILTEYPQYTRPEIYNNWRVPEVLLSGDHKKIAEWKARNSKR
ncbi:MAG: tRNA (guanosine(37)-N1)-methyltransferase TrmD [Patescibacteria group bacterium]|nr:tRNA (guanosine(37)-N1)-methyltransferase TrmD [Patescibacteria group bacterium]